MTTMMRTTAGAAYGRGEGKGELREGRMIETFWYRKIESIHLDHGLEGGCWSKIFDYDAFSFGGRLGCEQVARASSFSASASAFAFASAFASSSASASASASASTPSFFLILLCPHASFFGM